MAQRQRGSTATDPITPYTQKTIAVTGGAGFLGSYLCEALWSHGHRVVCIDNFHTGRKENVRDLLASNRFQLVEHDVTNKFPAELPSFDEIYNLACPASPIHYQANPDLTDILDQRDRGYCIAALRSRWGIAGTDVCGAGGR